MKHSFQHRLFAAMLLASLVPLLLCTALMVQITRLRMQNKAQEDLTEQSVVLCQSLDTIGDALTGAARLGDIGKLFPDTDPAYAGISSLKLLAEVGRLLAEKGYAVVNIDAVLLAQAPKVGPYRQQMAENMAAALNIAPEQVNVKATTEEGLGFTGDGSGMAAHAVVLVEKVK